MGLLPYHSAKLVLMREDDWYGGGLGMLDKSGSTAGQLDVVGVGKIQGLEVPSVSLESAFNRVYTVEVLELLV